MKSEHRHELKTNELAEWIANIPQWCRDNLRMIIYVSAVAVVVVVVVFLKWYNKNVELVQKQHDFTKIVSAVERIKFQTLQAQQQGLDASYMLMQTSDNLNAAARNAASDSMAALALIKQAETIRSELHYRSTPFAEDYLRARISKAKDLYADALNKPSASSSLKASAKFGIGLCEEELGNFDLAAKTYREITQSDDLASAPAAVSAIYRLETMADYRQNVFLLPAKQPEQIAPIVPQIQPQFLSQPSDANLKVVEPNIVASPPAGP